MSKRWQSLLLWRGVLLAFLAVAPLQAAERPQAWVRFSLGGAALTLCVEPATATALAQAPSMPALVAAARAPGATRCKPAQGIAAQQNAQRAGLVIDFGDGRVQSFCIDLGADGEMSGEELLRASQLPVVIEYSGLGGAVCKIGGVGTNFPDEPCFARCTLRPGEPCLYWAYSSLVDGAWQTSQIGASTTTIHAGEVDGWAWGQSSGSGTQPALRTFEQICAAATAMPTASATQPPQAQPSAPSQQFFTVVPSATPANSPTATSTPPLALAQPSRTPAPPTLAPAAPSVTPAPSAPPARTAVLASAPSATPAPQPTATPVPSNTPVREVQVQIPIAQNGALAAEPSAAPAPSVAASPPPVPTAIAPEPAAPAPAANPTRSYPLFAGMAALLVLAWALLRRRRA